MYVVTICILVCLLFTFRECKDKMKNGMAFGFAIVTFLGCIHYDYGNDYMSYYQIFKEVEKTDFNLNSVLNEDIYHESGWIFINYIFKYLGGFFVLVAFLNILQNIIVYRFIKNEVEKKWWLLATFIYLVTVELYLYNFSMMRQSFVVYMFLGMWPFIKKRNWIIPFIVLYLCSYVHSSGKFLMPFAFWGFVPLRNSKLMGFGSLGLFFLLWLSVDILNNLLMYTLNSEDVQKYFDRYGGVGKSKLSIGIGFLIQLLPFFIAIYALIKEKVMEQEHKRLLCLGILGFMVTPFTTYLPLLGRFGIYFTVFRIGAIPIIYNSIEKTTNRNILLSLFVLITFYDYFKFFSLESWRDSYSTFNTIFDILQ